MIDGDPNKPYYRAVMSSSSEGEVTDDEEGKKDDGLQKILPTPSEGAEEAMRKRLLEKHRNRGDEDDENMLSVQPKNKESRIEKPTSRSAPDRSSSSRRSAERTSRGSSRDHHRHSSDRSAASAHSPSNTRKRPPIKAPSPERKEKHPRRERDRHAEPKASGAKETRREHDRHKTHEKAAEEKKAVEVRRTSPPPTPPISDPASDEPTKTQINVALRTLASKELTTSNTSSPLPGMQHYSRFDSPEAESDEEVPVERPIEITMSSAEESDVEFEEHIDVHADENQLPPETKNFEDLSEEEKGALSPNTLKEMEAAYQKRLIAKLPIYYPGIFGCRSVDEFRLLNKIDEGTFGVVYRALEKRTDEVVALKRLKMEKEHEGFPVTSLREINMLMKCRQHPNVVQLREIVVGSNMDKIYLVMEFVEHDVKALLKQMQQRNKKFTVAQIKTLMMQLLSGVAYLHEEWVLHRDLKTSNLLLSHRNVLKIGDFGLAREYGEPLKPYTPVVVTLWYRSPELLLGTKKYATAIDVWSTGCIFGEFMKLTPIWQGISEIDQLNKIFQDTGAPNKTVWPEYEHLPGASKCTFTAPPYNQLRKRFMSDLKSEEGLDLLNKLLALDPSRRIGAEEASEHKFFKEDPAPATLESFPTWPAKSENLKAPPERPAESKPPKAPHPEIDPERLRLLKEYGVKPTKAAANSNFSLKLGPGR